MLLNLASCVTLMILGVSAGGEGGREGLTAMKQPEIYRNSSICRARNLVGQLKHTHTHTQVSC